MANKLFYSKLFIKDLLIIEALIQTSLKAPKTSQKILEEVEIKWNKIFPEEPLTESSTKTVTVSRHVCDMNRSGLFNIQVHPDNKRGYYNAKPIFNTGEAGALGAMIYHTSSLCAADKKKLFDKIKSVTDTDGDSIIYGFDRQVKDNPKNACLFKIHKICKAVVEGRKIKFELKQDSRPNAESERVTASPYFIICKDDEFFLTAKDDKSLTLTDFKIGLMSKIELAEKFDSDKNFSLSKNIGKQVELKINFPESFIERVIERFKGLKFSPIVANGRKTDDRKEYLFRTTIYVGEDDGLYQWLRQHCDKVNVIAPNNVKENLRKQFSRALTNLY